MKDYTISESFTLPSKGLIYDTKFDPIVTIHSMQTRHEMMRLSPGDYPYKSLCDIIDDCMVSDIPLSSYDMFFGDYQYLLYKLRTVTYGKEYRLSVTCPICGETYEGSIDLDTLEVLDNIDAFNKYLEFDLPYSKKHIVLNYQTPRMFDTIANKTKEFKKKSNMLSTDATIVYSTCLLIHSVDGKLLDEITLEDFVRNLPMGDTNTILQYAEKLNSSLGVNSFVECTCPVCGIDSKVVVRSDKQFFRPALDI